MDRIQIGQVLTNLVKTAPRQWTTADLSTSPVLCATPGAVRARTSQRSRLETGKAGLYVQIAIMIADAESRGDRKENFRSVFLHQANRKLVWGFPSYSVIQKSWCARSEVQSEPHKGTTFTPVVTRMDEEPSSALPEIPAAPDGEFRILVMDDDEQVIATAVSLLASFGYAVDIAKDGQEACEKYAAAFESDTPYDAVILDLVVPEGMSGQECAAAILTKDPAAVLIVSSGYSDDPVLAHWKTVRERFKTVYVDEMRRALLNVLVL